MNWGGGSVRKSSKLSQNNRQPQTTPPSPASSPTNDQSLKCQRSNYCSFKAKILAETTYSDELGRPEVCTKWVKHIHVWAETNLPSLYIKFTLSIPIHSLGSAMLQSGGNLRIIKHLSEPPFLLNDFSALGPLQHSA